jgi:hypothetical protein
MTTSGVYPGVYLVPNNAAGAAHTLSCVADGWYHLDGSVLGVNHRECLSSMSVGAVSGSCRGSR